jgi:hypothetical protein
MAMAGTRIHRNSHVANTIPDASQRMGRNYRTSKPTCIPAA